MPSLTCLSGLALVGGFTASLPSRNQDLKSATKVILWARDPEKPSRSKEEDAIISVSRRRTRATSFFRRRARYFRWISKIPDFLTIGSQRKHLGAVIIAIILWFHGPSTVAHAGIKVRCSNVQVDLKFKDKQLPLADMLRQNTPSTARTPSLKTKNTKQKSNNKVNVAEDIKSNNNVFQQFYRSRYYKPTFLIAAGGTGFLLGKVAHPSKDGEIEGDSLNMDGRADISSKGDSRLEESQDYVAKFLEEAKKLEEELFREDEEDADVPDQENSIDEDQEST